MEQNSVQTECDLIKEGQLIADTKTGFQYRVLMLHEDVTSLCQADCSSLQISLFPTMKLVHLLDLGQFIVIDETPTLVDHSSLSDAAKERYQRNLSIVQIIDSVYGPDYIDLMGHKKKNTVECLINDNNMSRPSFWNLIRQYLQSGRSPSSLVDNRANRRKLPPNSIYSYTQKTGRRSNTAIPQGIPLTDEVMQQFAYGLNEYKNNRNLSVHKAYLLILKKSYSSVTLDETTGSIKRIFAPPGERPSERQFEYYVNKNMNRNDKEIRKTSQREARNNSRLLRSDTLSNVNGPMDLVQIDECEIDVSLLSSVTDGQTIGRPIVYAMIDSYTKLCIAVGVAFDNNSVIGFTNCLLNLADDKVKLCKKYGVTIDAAKWPTGYLPNRIISDRGSEYLSNEMDRICSELAITHEKTPPAMGSFKGDVERFFGQQQAQMRPHVKGFGEISKRYDSKHHEQCVLVYDDFMKMLLTFVIFHNNSLIENYPLDKTMLQNNVIPTPNTLWEYGCRMFGTPRSISNHAQFMFSLMLPVSAGISRRGFKFKGLFYADWSDDYSSGILINEYGKRKKMEFRIDPRDIGCLYCVNDGHLCTLPLNDLKHGNASFAGLTLAEWSAVYTKLNAAKRDHKITKNEYESLMDDVFEGIVTSARRNFSGSRSIGDMRKFRRMEQMAQQNDNSIFARLNQILLEHTGATADDVIYSTDFAIIDDDIKEESVGSIPILPDTIDTASSTKVFPTELSEEDPLAAFKEAFQY